MESRNVLEILPPEVMILVFSNLEPEDIVSSLSVSKLWNALHKDINWKEAFVISFGELSSTNVDVSRNFNWRKLFFDRKALSSYMGKRTAIKEIIKESPKKERLYATESFNIRVVTKDNVIYSMGNNYFHIDLRTLKNDPTIPTDKLIPLTATLSLTNSLSYNTTNNKKDDLILEFSGYFVPNEPAIKAFAFWHLKKGVKALPSVVLPDEVPKRYNGNGRIYQNTKYILWIGRPYGCLIDTSKRCYHYCDFQKQGQSYARENFPTICENKEKCAIKETWSENHWYPFLSSEDPDLIVGVQVKEKDFELVISRVGQQKTEIHLDRVLTSALDNVKIGSENLIRSRKKIMKHWFSFEINNELYFVDLLNTTHIFRTEIVAGYKWLPNESKVVLHKKNMLIVFDLETKSRCSKITFQNLSRIADFSVLQNRAFIAVLEKNGKTFSICHWETAAQVQSIDVSRYNVCDIQFISDGLLVISSNTSVYYIKL